MDMSAPDAPQALARLQAVIAPRQRLLTAFSAGVDSTIVAVVARRVLGRDNAPAAIGNSASLPRRELHHARKLAQTLDLELIEVAPGEQADPDYQKNDSNRCYHCKTHLYESLHRLAAARQIPYIANGTNLDDFADHRPGLVAARQAQIVSPLAEAKFDKATVRAVAGYLNLPNADKPAAACLASRLPYGTAVNSQRLSQIEQAEQLLHDLGFRGFRVRHHDTVARIEIPWRDVPRLIEENTRQTIIARFKQIGYLYITLDLQGFRSGSANAALTVNNHPLHTL